MRILRLAPIWETVPPPAYGGTEVVVSVLTDELVRRGHDVILWASGDSVTTARLKSVVPKSLRSSGLTQEALQYALVHVASAIREANDVDIIHSHNGPTSELAMASSQTVATPFLTTLHCLPTEDTRLPLFWEEPFGLVMIEAMPCGTPIIAFARGAAPEIGRHGVNGFLVDDADGMTEAIGRLNDIDPEACRRSVEERFSPGALADRYLEVYRRMLRTNGSASSERISQAAGVPAGRS
ncbi:MAG: glycosyltransferase [Chloroflexi bacterium]|nr:glycosyltransferase [Chloroflexota bacterium]